MPEPIGNAQINPEAAQDGYMILVTDKAIGEAIELYIDAETTNQDKVWIDLNNDGIQQAEEKVTNFATNGYYTLGAQTVVVYGKITKFFCLNNQLTALDVKQNKELINLHCGENQLTALDVRQNTRLKVLVCYENQLTVLDVSQNKILNELTCFDNQLTTLDISKNTSLTSLNCSENQLTILDVSKNVILTFLRCNENQIKKDAMNALLESLPERPASSDAKIYILNEASDKEGNELPDDSAILAAKNKNWKIFERKSNKWQQL